MINSISQESYQTSIITEAYYKQASTVGLHFLSPYVGKFRPSLARYLINTYSTINEWVWDPFCGSGTVPLEAWVNKRKVIANDLNYYAYIMTQGKLNPPKDLDIALCHLQQYNFEVQQRLKRVNNYEVPQWIKEFFHPVTLTEIISWYDLLNENNEWFYITCLMGILHHQRPGFLSYPMSHGIPYLRNKNFPKSEFPEMYEYRNVYERLRNKVVRAFMNMPSLDLSIDRRVLLQCASKELNISDNICTIITSPPYMKSLDYAKDNRLRLWFLGIEDWQSLRRETSPNKTVFLNLMNNSFSNWSHYQKGGNYCIVIVGDIIIDNKSGETISNYLTELASDYNYKLINIYKDPIPLNRRVVKNTKGVTAEDVCVFQKK